MQLKYSFKKEWSQFLRTFRLWGIIITILSFAVSNPLMFKFTSAVMNQLADNMGESQAAITQTAQASGNLDSIMGELNFSDMAEMYNDAGMMFSTTLVSFAAYGLLITMLILMSAAGGEQKKRAMIVPMCSGLDYKNYLLPKFLMYPLTVFAVTFLSSLAAAGLCNVMFPKNKVTAANMMLCSLIISVYMAFMVTVFLSLGLCTSRPGIMAPVVFVGQMFLESLLNGMGITEYHPFAMPGYVNRITEAGYEISSSEGISLLVAILICVVVSVLMFFLALGVLKAKKIDNQEENKPEF